MTPGRTTAGGGKAASKRKAAESPTVIVLDSDASDEDAADAPHAASSKRPRRGRAQGNKAAAPLPTVQVLLAKLDDLHHTQHEGEGQKAVKRAKPKKAAAKAARGWSKGTGFGGSYESSRKDEELQERARAREVRCRVLPPPRVRATG